MNILFSFLFAFDILLGCFVGYFFDIWRGVIVAAVLIFINAVTYRVILKIQKIQKTYKKTN
jgi:hypothetical protein